jgi:RHS repeat-associated protein
LQALANVAGNRIPIRQGNAFAFDGEDRIDFEDARADLHFFFQKDYAWAVADSVTNFAGRVSVRRYLYSRNGKHYLLVGVPWNWINTAPQGNLIIDPPVTVTTVPNDAYIGSSPATANYGSNTQMWIGNHYPGICRALVQFDLTTSIPANAKVLSAQMKLYFASTSSGPVSRTIRCHQVLRSWSESTCTWNSPWLTPGLGITNGNDANPTPEDTQTWYNETSTWKSYNLSALTEKWKKTSPATPNYGVVLWATNESTPNEAKIVYSSEYFDSNYRPKLEVTYSTTAKTVYFLKDHLGSIRATVDASTGNAVGWDDYDPWGYTLAGRSSNAWGPTTSGVSKNKFTGKEFDDDLGVNYYYFGARYYDPQIGRWLVTDKMEEKYPSLSPYNYVTNNPLKFIDPDGEDVRFHASARKNEYFQEAWKLYLMTRYGFAQYRRIVGDNKILVIYQVANISKSAYETIGAHTDWWPAGLNRPRFVLAMPAYGLEYVVDNRGKLVITVTFDEVLLRKKSFERSAETIFHEFQSHVEYDRQLGSLTGLDVLDDHTRYYQKDKWDEKFLDEVRKVLMRERAERRKQRWLNHIK